MLAEYLPRFCSGDFFAIQFTRVRQREVKRQRETKHRKGIFKRDERVWKIAVGWNAIENRRDALKMAKIECRGLIGHGGYSTP